VEGERGRRGKQDIGQISMEKLKRQTHVIFDRKFQIKSNNYFFQQQDTHSKYGYAALLPVLFCLSYSVCLSCSASPALSVCLSCSCLSCPGCPALEVPSWQCGSACPVLAVLFSCPFLAVLF
jgi:hypothetical protein